MIICQVLCALVITAEIEGKKRFWLEIDRKT